MYVIQRSLFDATPAELRETAVVFGVVVLGFFLIVLLAHLISRRRGGSFGFWAIVLGSLGAGFLGASLRLDSRPPVEGVVESRGEWIRYTGNGPERAFRVRVRYRPSDTAESRSVELTADPETHDRYEEGDAIAVRHADFGGVWEFARLADRDTIRMLRSAVGGLVYPILIIGGVLATWLSARRKRNGRWVLAGLGLTALSVLVVFSLAQLPVLMPLRGPQSTATATVRAVHEIAETTRGSRTSPPTMPLLKRVSVVEVEFTPDGMRAPIVALDAVDAGSLVTEIGDEVTLRYRTDRPRTIRLTQGSRSFAWMNLIPLWISLAVLAPLATLMLGSRRGRRWLRVEKNPPRTHPGEANGSGAGA